MPGLHAVAELSLRVQRCCAACSGRRVQSRFLVFKDGHPSLVRLPSPVSSRLATMSRRSHPVALAEADARSVETVERRTSDAPSRSSVSPYARCLRRPVKNLRGPRVVKHGGVPILARLPPTPLASTASARASQPIGLRLSAELRGTKCYVAWGVTERGPLFRLCSPSTGAYEWWSTSGSSRQPGVTCTRSRRCPARRRACSTWPFGSSRLLRE